MAIATLAPPRQRITMIRGQDVKLRPALTPPGSIAGWTFRFILQYPNDTVALTKTSPAGGITITDVAVGVIEIAIAAGDTFSLRTDIVYDWELWRTGAGVEVMVAQGEMRLGR